MPRPPIDLPRKIKDILTHFVDLPAEAAAPLTHYRRSGADIWNLLLYVERNLAQLELYPAVLRRHLGRLNGMILISLIEAFERYLKEIAAVCVDSIAPYVLDERFNAFRVQGSSLAAHYGANTLGKSLCEAITWLNCSEVNDRFKKLLSHPFTVGNFEIFARQPPIELQRFETLNIIWQLRHTVVHNVGVITNSDAIKLRLLAKEHVEADRMLAPTRDDLRYLKRFLDEAADRCNTLIGDQLALLLTAIHADNPSVFVAQEIANEITATFGNVLSVNGALGIPPS
jgi:hypothetical protein